MPFEVRKPKEKPAVLIRSASGHELSEYEKNKLANIEDNAQENKIESIKLNDQRLQIDKVNKEVTINLGDLAFKSKITAEDLDTNEIFFIKCELDESNIGGKSK
jgi:predicted metalloprotease with PDZ domain